MPRGRKFDAAEKHFKEKEISYGRIIKDLNWQLTETRADLRAACQKIDDLQRQTDKLLAERDELLKLVKMSPEELQKHMKNTEGAALAVQMLSLLDLKEEHINEYFD